MHPRVLSSQAWKTIRALREAGLLDSWLLGGGTGLALFLGHRYSEDLDFFRVEPFEPGELVGAAARLGAVHIQRRSAGRLHMELDGLRLSYLAAEAPFLFPGTPYRGLTVADPRDIAVVEVVAIGGRGARKDFLDLYFYLRGGETLERVFDLLRERFPGVDHNTYHLLKSLAYVADAEEEPMPALIRQVEWEAVKAFFIREVRRLS
jgi:hypothetical protein